ncbi:MAG: nucleoside triphosphate pyrophosphohydrolase [Bacillota bacterium]
MQKIIVIGLGPSKTDFLSREAFKYLKGRYPVYLQKLQHPAARLIASKKKVHSFERFYKKAVSFEQANRTVSNRLIRAAKKHGIIYYAVPGNPFLEDASTKHLRKICSEHQVKLEVIPAPGFLESFIKSLQLGLHEGMIIKDAQAIERQKEPSPNHLVFVKVWSRPVASRLKKRLMDLYPKEHPVTVIRAAGMKRNKYWKLPLRKLDQRNIFISQTAVYLPPYQGYTMGDLIAVMGKLRAEDGCPWDKQQTHQSLRQYLVEEAYEVIAAIEQQDDSLLREELGDLLLQVVFHSRIASEDKRFGFFEVVDDITEKLIRRHPHVFGRENAADPSEVKVLWEQIKSDERKLKNRAKAADSRDKVEKEKEDIRERHSVDPSLPALLKAYKLQKKAAEAGFDWPCVQGALDKAREELNELEEAFASKNQDSIEEELGDYLFTIVNISRFIKVNPELALGKAVNKFMDRFHYVLEQVEKTGHPITSFSLETLDKWWEEAKKLRKIRK